MLFHTEITILTWGAILIGSLSGELTLIDGYESWFNSKTSCQADGGLAMVMPKTDQEFVTLLSFAKSKNVSFVWLPIFLNCNTYIWADGQVALIANSSGTTNPVSMEWQTSEPNNPKAEFCVALKTTDLRLHDVACSAILNAVCDNNTQSGDLLEPNDIACFTTTTVATTKTTTTTTTIKTSTTSTSTPATTTTRMTTHSTLAAVTSPPIVSESQKHPVDAQSSIGLVDKQKGKQILSDLKRKSSNIIVASIFPDDLIQISDPTKKLVTLMQNCDHFAPHRTSPPEPTKVTFNFGIDSVIGIDTVEQVFAVEAMLALTWKVETCAIDAAGNLSSGPPTLIQISSSDSIWLPRYRFLTSSTSNSYLQTKGRFGETLGEDLLATIGNEDDSAKQSVGFYWLKAGAFSSSCQLDLKIFPFDKQTCLFSFSLIRANYLVHIDYEESRFLWPDGEDFDGEWHYRGRAIFADEFHYGAVNVSGIHFAVTLARNPSYYVNNLVIPASALALLELSTFILPPGIPDRSAMSMTILLALAFTQSTVLQNVPKTSQKILLIDYVQYLTWLCTGCLTFQMFICCVGSGKKGPDSSRFLRRAFFNGKLSLIRLIDFLAFTVSLAAGIVVGVIFAKTGNSD